MKINDDGKLPPYEEIAALIDAPAPDESGDFDSGAWADHAPHPTEALGNVDSAESKSVETTNSANTIRREALARCVDEPQNDTGNGHRLLHHFGDDLLHVRGGGWHAWAETHWEREGGNETATRLAQTTAARIALEAGVMAASSNEQRLIDAANAARNALVRMEAADGTDVRKTQRWKKLMDVVAAGRAGRRRAQ